MNTIPTDLRSPRFKNNMDPIMPENFHDTVLSATRRIPPLWPLRNFVAVNPFMGLAGRPFPEAARLIQRVGHGDILMPASYYIEKLDGGHIRESDLTAARGQIMNGGVAPELDVIGPRNLAALRKALQAGKMSRESGRIQTVADWIDGQMDSDLTSFIVDEISKWCSVYFDEGQSSWRMPWRGMPFYSAWRQAARYDANPLVMGLKDLRPFVSTLPVEPLETIWKAIQTLGIPETGVEDFLHRQLMSVAGWSSHIQYRVREKQMQGDDSCLLIEFLAVKLAYELLLFKGMNADLRNQWKSGLSTQFDSHETIPGSDILTRLLAQLALENSYQHQLMQGLLRRKVSPQQGRRLMQAVFCIDVRSELFRRNLESVSSDIETLGFAGFFGMTFEYQPLDQNRGQDQCPVLLTPRIKIREGLQKSSESAESHLHQGLVSNRRFKTAWNAYTTSAVSCFSFVETMGMGYGIKLLKEAFGLSTDSSPGQCCGYATAPQLDQTIHHHETGIDPAGRITMAAGALKNIGLTSGFAKTVLICGHGSQTRNNPYGSGLDCGACGGHAGDVNARLAATLFNDPDVRAGLRKLNIDIPDDTLFIAGLHNTTTDDVQLFVDDLPQSTETADIEPLRQWLDEASKLSRKKRSEKLDCHDFVDSPGLDERIRERSRDWSQVRPEWGLAGNAAIIAAPRSRTQGLNLKGRVFLHNYAAAQDPDGSVLELILTAPVIVASWINLQYYASTVNNRLFGSGNKVIHNVVGVLGVWQGNAGDLQTGLPLQSLHDGVRWIHEPLRLSVFIEAPRDAIDRVLEKHRNVRELMDNGWLHLFSIEPDSHYCWRYSGKTGWKQEERPL